MATIAFLFPGQGSQCVGMGREFFENDSMSQSYFERADTALGFPLSEICLNGPADKLQLTMNTQPAILLHSVIAAHYLMERGVRPLVAAGHSLGEISAVTSLGALKFEDGMRLVHNRGRYMQEAVPVGEGAMAAIIDFPLETIRTICDEYRDDFVTVANINSPQQVVISGRKAGVEKVGSRLMALGARRILPLDVSAPFHCPLMKPAAEKLARDLDRLHITRISIPLITNVDVLSVSEPDEIRSSLIRQVDHPVRWQEIILSLLDQGIDTFIEVGPGKVLTGLMKRIARGGNWRAFAVSSPQECDNVVKELI